MKSHELAKLLLKNKNSEIYCSVDISTGEDDADRRCFGRFEEINYVPTDDGFGLNEIMLLFSGKLNDDE